MSIVRQPDVIPYSHMGLVGGSLGAGGSTGRVCISNAWGFLLAPGKEKPWPITNGLKSLIVFVSLSIFALMVLTNT